MICTTNLHNGLYFLNFPSNNTSMTTNCINKHLYHLCNHIINKYHLWHSRLGHPSHETLTHINKDFNLQLSFKPIFVFYACFYAKQILLPFSISVKHFPAFYDLVNIYIWGPYLDSIHARAQIFLNHC